VTAGDVGATETPIFIACGEEALFGILTAPAGEPNGLAALILWGSGGMPSFGQDQLRARIARRLAGRGYHALRIDYLGIGESTGTASIDDLSKTPVAEVAARMSSSTGGAGSGVEAAACARRWRTSSSRTARLWSSPYTWARTVSKLASEGTIWLVL